MKTSLALAALALAAASLTACSTESEMRGIDPAAHGGAEESGESGHGESAADADAVRTQGLATVLDAGEGPQLCLGAVAQSLPPQCSGLPMEGWDWAEHKEYDEAQGVKWGSFAVTGHYDGETFEVTDAIPAALYDTGMTPEPKAPGTPCKQLNDVIVPETSTPEARDATLNAAAALPNLAMTWMDGEVINVAVTDDVDGAKATLLQTWGGLLCVSKAEHTERELGAIQQELNKLPGVLTSGSTRPDHIEVTVVHDDGSIQEQLDEEYGEGMVEVSSALVPAS